jgi:hypothetical protein
MLVERSRLLVAVCIIVCCMAARSQAWEERVPLLQVSQGQKPNDTAMDNRTKLSLEESAALGGKALKVEYAVGDAFGTKGIGERNWKPFVAVEFSVLNPSREDVKLTFVVKHRRTTNYQTRVDRPVVLKPGKNNLRLGIDELANVNGSAPDLSAVQHWYLSNESGKPITLYFGDFWLTGGEPTGGAQTSPSREAAAALGGLLRSGGAYRIQGTIGDLKVDLTISPLENDRASVPAADSGRVPPTAGAAVSRGPATPRSDPDRLARIRANRMPPIDRPIMFDTPEADAMLAALEIFPPDNPFNQLIEDWPLHPDSRSIVASIGIEKPLRYNPDMGFILVPANQPPVDVKLMAYPDESDPGPYPVPENTPIEGWPVAYERGAVGKSVPSLEQIQRRDATAGDRHAIVVDPVGGKLYEFFVMGKTADGWAADQASIFDLRSNRLRPQGWTSADAAGLPIFPAVVRYDELRRGMVEHAMRVTVRRSRRAYVHPATHYASSLEDSNLPRMGERLRLRADFDLAGFSPPVLAILKGLKKYGMFVADNGIEWAISVTPDHRIPDLHEELRKIKGADFEVVVAPSQAR